MQHTIVWCYLCQTKHNLTRDHIPPENLFPAPRPSNLITVPCCRTCNESFGKVDEQFRAFITSPVNVSVVGRDMMRRKVVGSSFKRSPALRKQMGEGIFKGSIMTALGEISVPLITVGRPAFDKFFIRLTKGLLATFHTDIGYFDSEFVVRQLDQFGAQHPTFLAVTSTLIADQRGDGIFRFWRGIARESDGIAGVWIYQFYDAAIFMVTHASKAGLMPPHSK